MGNSDRPISQRLPVAMRDDGTVSGVATSDTTTPTFGAPERRLRRVGTSRARRALKAEHMAQRSNVQVFADALMRAAGSTLFLVLHVLWFATWIAWNTGRLGREPFDPFPFGLLTMVVSLEAIFLTILVLLAQRRESEIAELREEITLQVNLRMEEEVTKTLQLVAGLYTRLGHQLGEDDELRTMLQPLDAAEIERDLIDQISDARRAYLNRAR